MPQNTVYPIYEDRDGVVWVGTTEGLFRCADGRFVLEPCMSKGVITALANAVEPECRMRYIPGATKGRAVPVSSKVFVSKHLLM